MDVAQLRELGGFVPSAPVSREITWQPLNEDGSPRGEPVILTAHIKKLPAGAIELLYAVNGKHQDHARISAYIAEAVYTDASGRKKSFTYEDAYQLQPTLQMALWNEVAIVNGTKEEDGAKNSAPPTSSGATSLQQASAA